MASNNIHQEVQDYYGKVLQTTNDLKTNACCTTEVYPKHIKEILTQIHDEVMSKYYGCGLTIPDNINNLKVLDLGSGSGRDCFIVSKLVGETGWVTGIDMTDEQLEIAKKHNDYHAEKFKYKKANTEFLKGNIEELDSLSLKSESYDLIISNCVINLANNKLKVLKDSFQLLKEGGEMYFSDIYVNRRIPQELVNDPILYGECLSGALYWNDFQNMAKLAGFKDPRVVDSRELEINNPKIKEQLKDYKFYSVTYRLFKISSLEPACEDYGQAVIYKGGIFESPNSFKLDDHHIFPKGKVIPVCGNSFDMLNKTRFKNYFEFIGNTETHYGIYPDCGVDIPYQSSTPQQESNSSACC